MPANPLLESLRSVRRRVRWMSAGFGVAVTVAAGGAGLLALVLLDYLLNLPTAPRIVLLLAAVGAVGVVIARFLFRPLLSAVSLADVAGRVELLYPQFQDRLRSTVDILDEKVPGSDAMKQQVLTETATVAAGLDFRRAVVTRPLWYAGGAGTAALTLVLLLAVVSGAKYTQIALRRLLLPFAGQQWPKTVQAEVVGQLPTRLAVGQQLDLNVKLTRGDRASRTATVFYEYGDATGHFPPPEQAAQVLMARGDDGVYHAALDARLDSAAASGTGAGTGAAGAMRVWVQSGDGEITPFDIRIVQRPALRSIEAIVTPPPYATAAPVTIDLSQNPAAAVVGSTISLRATFSKPLAVDDPLALEPLAAAPPVLRWEQRGPQSVQSQFVADSTLRFHLRATDVDGFQNTAVEEYEVAVHPDQMPGVQLESPRQDEDRTPTAVVPVAVIAEDDLGVTALALSLSRASDHKTWTIPLVDAAAPTPGTTWTKIAGAGDLLRYRANRDLDLSKLNVQPGDVLELCAIVQDNFALNGQTHPPVSSSKLRLNIISPEKLAEQITDELRNIGQSVASVRSNQLRTARETTALARQTQAHPKLDDADQVAAERLASQQDSAAAETKQLAGRLDALLQRMAENQSTDPDLHDTARDASALLSRAAEDPMKTAAGAIARTRQSASAADRNQQFASAQSNQQAAADQLQKVLDRMGNVGDLSHSIDQLKQLLTDQHKVSAQTAEIGRTNLGKTPEQMSDADRQKLADNAAAQAALAQRTDKAMAQMSKSAQQLGKTDPAAAEAMKQAAATAQQQGVSANQQKAADAASQNQQSAAQSAQKQAELGLQTVLNQLDEAQRRKLEVLAKQLEDLQKQLGNLIRRQAGHNLDNLAAQGPDKLAALDSKQRDELLKQADRDAASSPPADAPTISVAQEQTEKNTRDLSQTAANLPDGNGVADHLTDAADAMERAIVHLRAGELVDALTPSQTDALAALQAAQRIVDQQKAKVDQKKQDQQREAIRQVYVRLKAEQDKLNAETLRIAAVPKGDDGSLPRLEAVRLGQLPAVQGKLADDADKLNADLSALGSIVYIWANKDIVSVMNGVKDQLGQADIGAGTQADQQRVSQQLAAMIADLAVKPIQSQFAQHDSGGGGGGGGQSNPGLPSEPELRLLKDLQLAVNDATKSADKQPATALKLGTRQGELRALLDQVLQQSSHGQMKLGPEPDNRDQLPEEANAEQIENQELDTSLLNDKPGADVVKKDMDLVGDRMARARQRLALNNDPGAITQKIQDRIVDNLDGLIEMARKKQAQSNGSPSGSPSPGEMAGQPKPGQGQPQNTGSKPDAGLQQNASGSNAASKDYTGGGAKSTELSADIRQKMSEWGGLTPRQRQAVIEGAGEQVLDKYKSQVDDYYRSLASKTDREP